MSCGVGYRHDLDPVLLWLWCRLAATAPIRPLAWEPPYATGAALEKAKRQKKKKKENDVSSGFVKYMAFMMLVPINYYCPDPLFH